MDGQAAGAGKGTIGRAPGQGLRPVDGDASAPPALARRLAELVGRVRGRALAGRLVVLALILAAFACQTYRLAGQSLWYDEAVTARVATQGVAELTRWTADDIQPPLYYYVVAGWTRAAGRSEWALRFPSVWFAALLVPLLWVLARRLFGRGAPAATLAALLAALSPLYTYYAQEARMYTQLTALAALAGYALLRAGAGGLQPGPSPAGAESAAAQRPLRGLLRAPRLSWWAVFVLAAAAALYTHYFAAFLLLAYALYFIVAWAMRSRGRGPAASWRTLRPGVAAAGAVVLLYLPWLPVMLNRLQVDRSYWQGTLKLDEALRHIAISFAVAAPETMLESEALRWLPWFAVAFLISLIALLAWSARSSRRPAAGPGLEPHPLLFLLLTLLAPTLGVLALASRTPKFNARYLMLVSPAYLLILAGGLAALLAPGNEQPRGAPVGAGAGVAGAPRRLTRLGQALGLALLLLVVVVPAKAQYQWLAGDPGFTKAQWREVAATVRREIAPGETVLLVSGHAAPAWDYYAADIPAVRLPVIDVLDVQAVLGFASGATLQAGLAGKTGAWVVFWQAATVDPVDFTTYYLDRAGSEVPVGREFWQLHLRHWRLRPAAQYPDRPQPQHAAGQDQANFGHQLALLGWDEPRGGQLTLYWQALNAIGAHDYQVSLHFEDAAGREVGPRWDGRPAGYAYPTDRWSAGRPLFGRYPLPALPPGRYYVTVAVYDAVQPSGLDIMDVADNAAGKRIRLGPFAVP